MHWINKKLKITKVVNQKLKFIKENLNIEYNKIHLFNNIFL